MAVFRTQVPDIMQCNVIGSGFSTHFSLGVNWGSLMLSRFNFVLVYAAMPSLLAWYILYSAYLPSKFLEKHSCQYFWTLSILKMRGENLQRWGWIARKVESIPWYCKGELRLRMPTLGFWPSTLHCPQKSVISRYSWKPAHCHSNVFITGWCNCCSAVRGRWSHPQFRANRVGENAPNDSDSTPHATWWHYPPLLLVNQ